MDIYPTHIPTLVQQNLVQNISEAMEAAAAFGLEPVVFPDLSDSLDGHLTDQESSPVTVGGTPVADIAAGMFAATAICAAVITGLFAVETKGRVLEEVSP